MSGIIPGETDYRIYRDFGHIPGFDAAFVMDGWAYHNAHDSFARLAPHAGIVIVLVLPTSIRSHTVSPRPFAGISLSI